MCSGAHPPASAGPSAGGSACSATEDWIILHTVNSGILLRDSVSPSLTYNNTGNQDDADAQLGKEHLSPRVAKVCKLNCHEINLQTRPTGHWGEACLLILPPLLVQWLAVVPAVLGLVPLVKSVPAHNKYDPQVKCSSIPSLDLNFPCLKTNP